MEKIISVKNLKKAYKISLVSQKGNQFTIRLESICFDEFVKKLVANQLHIHYLSMRKHSLQDLFLKLTGGD